MKIRSNLTPGMIALLVFLGILFAVIVIPILFIIGLWYLLVFLFTGRTPSLFGLFRGRKKARRGEDIYDGPFEQDSERHTRSSAINDDTIECEVISAKTLDENGQEIR